MRVLRISHSAVVTAWRERERALRRSGVDVRLISARVWDEGGAPVRLEARRGEMVVGVRTLGSHPALFLYDPIPLWRALRADWDVLDIHEEPFALATAQVLALAWLRRVGRRRHRGPASRVPYVVYSAQNIAKRYPWPFRWFEARILRGAVAVSVCNDEAGRIVRAKGARGAVETIPLGVDLGVFHPGPHAEREAALAKVTGPVPVVVGYAGRLAGHKGVGVLLDAVADDSRLHLRIAGAGPDEAELREQAAALGDRVVFAGSLSDGDLADFYRGLDVLAVPSLTTPSWIEQFGRVAVEAMACGVPVVASDSGALPDVVAGAGLLVPPGDPDALREALLRVGTDPALAARLAATARRRAHDCSWPSVADRYRRLYEEVAKTADRQASTPSSTPAPGTRPTPADTPRPPTTDHPPAPTSRGGVEVGRSDVRQRPSERSGRRLRSHERSDRARALPTSAPPQPPEIIVVAYRAPHLIRAALAPLGDRYPVTVVDNSSLPEIRAVADELGARYLDPGRNGGFAAGVNHGLAHRQAPGADVLLLNPDAIVAPADVEELHRALTAAGAASAGPVQVDDEGTAAQVAWPYPSPAATWLEAAGLASLRRTRPERSFVIGSVLLLSADALADVGGFDERFFLYAEETDWAYRATRRGWRHVVVPGARAVHLGGATSTDPARRETHFHASQERYLRKHYGAAGWQVARVGQVAGSAARSLVLRGEGRAGARRRLALYLRGPVRAEGRLSGR